MILASYYEKYFAKHRPTSFDIDYIERMVLQKRGEKTKGMSGARFWFLDSFVVKTISSREISKMEKHIADYTEHIRRMKTKSLPTLMSPIYGMYKMRRKGIVLHFMVMKNVMGKLISEFRRKKQFDLKGIFDKSNKPYQLKSRNLCPQWNPSVRLPEQTKCEYPFVISKKDYDKLILAIQFDTQHLALNHRYDYSLVVGFSASSESNRERGTWQIPLVKPHPMEPSARSIRVGIVDYTSSWNVWRKLEGFILNWNPYTSYAKRASVSPESYRKRFIRFMKIAMQPK